MKARTKEYFSIFVALLYLSSVLYVELGHSDLIEGDFGSVHHLLSHNCTSNEVHHPLGSGNECPVCQRISQTIPFVNSLSAVTIWHIEVVSDWDSRTDISCGVRLSLSVRGPPPLLSYS